MNKEELLKLIPEIRTWENMSQKDMAKRLGIAPETLQYYLRKYPQVYAAVHKKPAPKDIAEASATDYVVPFRIIYDNCLTLGGAVIRYAMLDYAHAIYHSLKGDKIYRDRVMSSNIVYTVKELQNGKNFIYGGGLEFWGDGMILPETIYNEAHKIGERMYNMEIQAKAMTTEELKEFYKIIRSELQERQHKLEMERRKENGNS